MWLSRLPAHRVQQSMLASWDWKYRKRARYAVRKLSARQSVPHCRHLPAVEPDANPASGPETKRASRAVQHARPTLTLTMDAAMSRAHQNYHRRPSQHYVIGERLHTGVGIGLSRPKERGSA